MTTEIIEAFLSVRENQPKLFSEVSSDHLQELQNSLIKLKNESDQAIADFLDEWLGNHEKISDAVEKAMSGQKKLDASANIPPTPDINNPAPSNEQIRINQYPEISEILRNRLPKATEQNQP
jgi:hypothetical protein